MAVKTRRGTREPLTLDRVLATAMAMADAGGIGAVTMRRLAQELGVEAMSLYHYAPSKDDILAGITELVIRQIELPVQTGDWKPAIRACAISAHEVLRQHPWACNLLMSGDRILPGRLAMIDAILARLEDAQLPGETLDLAYHALDSHILGFTLWEAGYSSGMRNLPTGDLDSIIRSVGLSPYPHLVAHAAWHLEPARPGHKPAFEFGLDLILDGVDAGPTA
jgi:AcrR family transcriptional regulator